jgi:(+)-trans-carveol dehydrogenase
MGRLDGKVAFVTGAARGQGRSHAVRFAQEGADIIATDISTHIESVPYPLASADDLAGTVEAVQATGRRIVAAEADVRDYDALKAALEDGVAQLGGRLDIVVANAGIATFGPSEEMPEQTWQDMIDINLTGVWHTCKAAIPRIADGGSIILTSSTAGLGGFAALSHYSAAKHGVVGLTKSLARELGPRMIRVNSVHPTTVDTPMVLNEATFQLFAAGDETFDEEAFKAASAANHVLPIPWVESIDISNAVLFLASDEARYITGVALPIDAGLLSQ